MPSACVVPEHVHEQHNITLTCLHMSYPSTCMVALLLFPIQSFPIESPLKQHTNLITWNK